MIVTIFFIVFDDEQFLLFWLQKKFAITSKKIFQGFINVTTRLSSSTSSIVEQIILTPFREIIFVTFIVDERGNLATWLWK